MKSLPLDNLHLNHHEMKILNVLTRLVVSNKTPHILLPLLYGYSKISLLNLIKDIGTDDNLIDIARKNINHYLEGRETAIQPKTKAGQESDASAAKSSGLISKNPDIDAPLTTDKPPLSFTSQRGNILPPVLHPIRPDGIFPNNILFFSGDYCPKTDDHVLDQTPEYDTILCLSVTKWVHLNNHDEGLLRLFQRIYRALRTGGYFILEPQGWGSYNKKKRSFPEYLRGNLKELKLRPDMFEKILVEQIGFKDNVVKVTPNFIDKHKKTNFERDIFIFEK